MESYNQKSIHKKLYKRKKKEKHTLKYNSNYFDAVLPEYCSVQHQFDEDIQRDVKLDYPKFAHLYEQDAEFALREYTRQALVSTIRTGSKKKKRRGPLDVHALLEQDDRILVTLVIAGVEQKTVRLKVAFEQPQIEEEFDANETRPGELRSHFGFDPTSHRHQAARGHANGREVKTKKVKRKKAKLKKPKPLQMTLHYDEEEYETDEDYMDDLVWEVVVHAQRDFGVHGWEHKCGA